MPRAMPRPRRVTTSQAPLSDQPWWVKTIVWVGVPTAGFGVMLWFILGNFSRQIETLVQTQTQHQADMAQLVSQMKQESAQTKQQADAQLQQAWVQLGVMQRICLNTSKTDADRIACASLTQRPPP